MDLIIRLQRRLIHVNFNGAQGYSTLGLERQVYDYPLQCIMTISTSSFHYIYMKIKQKTKYSPQSSFDKSKALWQKIMENRAPKESYKI